jgi:hypothetical protein
MNTPLNTKYGFLTIQLRTKPEQKKTKNYGRNRQKDGWITSGGVDVNTYGILLLVEVIIKGLVKLMIVASLPLTVLTMHICAAVADKTAAS